MQYVLMIYAAENRFASMTREAGDAVMQAYGTYTKDLMGTGIAGDCAALEGTPTATTVQIRDGKRIVKDGPFAETREQLGGYYALDAASEEQALEWAAKIPDAKGGSMEVRPLIPTVGPATRPDTKGKKEYLLLVYEAESRWAGLSEADVGATFGKYRAFNDELIAKGQLVASGQLDSVQKAKVVSLTGDGRVVKDGPFAETREQLGGYYRVVAANLDEAIAMAERLPAAETGTIEIRPVADTSAYV